MNFRNIPFFTLAVSVFVVGGIIACNKRMGSTEKPPAASAKAFIMHIGHAQTDESPRHRSLLHFKNQVEKQTHGLVRVEIFANGIVGDEIEMTKAVSQGKLEAVRGGDLEVLPESMLLGLPMIADSLEEARKLCHSDFTRNMLCDAESENLMVLAVGDDSGFRQITNSIRPITKPSDFEGLKIRAPQITATIDFINELGASAEVIPFTELYAALTVGTVAGQENPLALIDSSKFYEVQKYCTIINYQFFPEMMYVSLEWWKSLPEEFQKILTECAKEMMEENARITDAENESYIKHIKAAGCEIVTLTPEQRAEFLPYAERVWKKYIDDGYATKDELKAMLSVVGKTINW
ncbi:MAG: TRAP transporter substrate-binding protein [Treponema sp.]|nr:TRAP transporter substrate-binding protein [Treponema sp.]